jgi:hypothetical protein
MIAVRDGEQRTLFLRTPGDIADDGVSNSGQQPLKTKAFCILVPWRLNCLPATA